MAKDKIILAELDIDAKALVKSSMDIKKNIEELIQQQAKLTEKGKESSAQFITNEAAIKRLEAAYKSQVAAISAYTNEEGKMVSQKKAIKDAVKEVNDSENDYISNNRELIELKKQLNSNDDDYEKRLAKINAKLLENNNWLKENGSEHAKLVTTMDDYKQQIAESFDSINIFNGGLSGLISRAQEAGGAGPLLSNAFKGITGGISGMTKAAWGFVTNPIGAILTALVLIIQGGVAIFKNFTPMVEKVEQVMAAVGAVFESVKNSVIGLLTGATSLGDFFSDFAGSAAEAADEAMKLEESQQKLTKQMELQEIANEEAKRSIDDLRAASEDSTKSEEERLNALKSAADIEMKNFKQRKAQAEEAYRIAQGEIANGKNLSSEEKAMLKEKGLAYAQELANRKAISQEELDALKKAQVERTRIYSEESALSRKQAADLTRLNDQMVSERQAEEKEAERKAKEFDDARKKRQDDAIERQKQQLALFAAEGNELAKTLQEKLKFEDDYAKKSLAILQQELKLKKISLEEFKLAESGILHTQGENKLRIAQDHARATLDLWKEQHKNQMKSGADLTAEMVAAEEERLANILKQNTDMLDAKYDLQLNEVTQKQANNEALNQEEMEYLTESLRLHSEFETQTEANKQALKDADEQRKLAERQKEAEDRSLKYDTDLAQELTEYEEKKILEQERFDEEKALLDARLADGVITKELYNAQLAKADKQLTDTTKALDKEVADNKLAQQTKMMDDMASILGKESKAGKAFALAKTTIDTYQGAVAAYTSQVVPGDPTSVVRGAIAAAAVVAMGLKNVQKIAGVKDPKFEKGGLLSVGGSRHSAGGTKFMGSDGTRFEAEQGEIIGIMNRNAAHHFMAFNNAFPSGGTSAPNYFANGGIVSREIAQQNMNMDELAGKIAEANRAIPGPVVAVQDIITQGNSYVQVRDGANF